ncbi:putative GYF-like domain-containing protein [Lupinus albus]|uniref:Putative GYF-like domain-containing protein n=1 Tax=Lupinus albus TaxID=3870 RepID=A0A6A4PQK9_LUPAL|nr:putative GYF-like domain-containing protein [Lupinus albus]
MAERTVSVTPFQIRKDFQGSDGPIPLSPQWRLPKSGDSKPGSLENHMVSNTSYGNHTGEDAHDGHKRKDVFRPSVLNSEGGRYDLWRDEERDTKSAVRIDRWKDGDKDLGGAWRVEQWTESSATRHLGEPRRGTSDRWNDSGNREGNLDLQRESKWNTRCGPDDKEPEDVREKLDDSGKDSDLHLGRGLSHISNHGKDEKEGDRYRPWRPNSTQGCGRVDPPYIKNVTPKKQVPTFCHGRGRGEDTPPVFTLGRARPGSGGSYRNSTSTYSEFPGTVLDKFENEHEEACPFRYSRAKLLDVYRVTDMHTDRKLVDAFVQVSRLTKDDPLEPLALCAPNSEELSVLNGIDEGEILSSDAPQVPKDGRSSIEFTHSRQMKHGSPLQDRGEHGGSYRAADEVPSNRESTFEGNSSVHPAAAWHAMPLDECTSTVLHDRSDVSRDVSSRSSDMIMLNEPKDPITQLDSKLDYLSDTRNVAKWQVSEVPIFKRQLSGIFDSELDTRRIPQTPPEELSFFYKDPRGLIQGPFKGIDIIGWFEAGYFGIDLPVCLENAAADSPWLQLGDAMPHLRAKARLPPGFPATTLDFTEAPGRQNSSTLGNIHAGLSNIEMSRNDYKHRQGSTAEAENRFLESLMSGNKNSPTLHSLTLSEGLPGFVGNNSGNLAPPEVDSGSNLYLLAQRMANEQQRSLPNPYPYWPGRDVASLVSKSDVVPDGLTHSQLLPSLSDDSRQFQSQNSELMSIFQGLSNRSSSGLNNTVSGWPNYPLQGGLDPIQNKNDLHRNQNYPQMPFGIQQGLQSPNQLSTNSLIAPAADNPSSILTAEKLLASGLLQDPQILNMLQQQYLLQLHSQAAAPAHQMPLLDKLLLLKKLQQQEEQQLLLRQQQQQLISRMLQEHQSHQHFGDLSYGHLQAGGIPIGNLHLNSSQVQQTQDIFPMSSQAPVPRVREEVSINSLNSPHQVIQGTSYNASSEASVQLSHLLFGNINRQRSWGPNMPEQINEDFQKEMLPASTPVGSSVLHENESKEEPSIDQRPFFLSDYTSKSVEQMLDGTCQDDGSVKTATSESGKHSRPEQCVAPVVAISSAGSCGIQLPLASELGQDVEITSDSLEEQQTGKDSSSIVPFVVDTRNVEAHEPKKATEKKSKKQKSAKSQSSDQAKGLLKNVSLQESKKSETEMPNYSEINVVESNNGDPAETYIQQTRGDGYQTGTATTKLVDNEEVSGLPASIPGGIAETVVVESGSNAVSSVATESTDLHSGRAWKPAPEFKTRSLLEIQQEEQRKAHTEMLVSEIATDVNSMSLATPWVGTVANPDSTKVSSESHSGSDNTQYLAKLGTSQNIKESPLHDLLAGVNKFSDLVPDSILSSQNVAVHSEPIDDGNFIEAKGTKRNRKRSAKSKGSGAKLSVPTASSEVPVGSSPTEKGKISRSVQQEKEQLPAIPAGPCIGDFVLWKGEPASPSPSPAWTTDSGRVPKPKSLRDIQKEQEKKASSRVPTNQLPIPQKLPPAQAARSNGHPLPISASSPSKAALPIQINSQASKSKYKGGDDLFWGQIEKPKQETNQPDLPQLSSQGSWGSKNIPIKDNSVGQMNRQKSGSGKSTERSLSSSPASSQSFLKSKNDAMTKNSEAIDFRVWCENECVRLLGTKDTNFLEFCLKQSRSEAEMLLIENLGSYDPDHEFIDKFLNYMELLPSDVLEIAFQIQNYQKLSGTMVSGSADLQDHGHSEGSSKGGKKKGKKGKKVGASVLGFQVVSNRIMMGEIQTVEE